MTIYYLQATLVCGAKILLNFAVKPRENGRNIVGCYMLRPFAHPVTCCCVLLGVAGQQCCVRLQGALRVMLHGAIRNDDF